jgi:uncharacterized protein (DUF58 family)
MKRFALNIAGLMVAIVAVLFALPSLYLMAAVLWLIPAVSYLMGWLMLGGLTCERSLPLSATAGEALPLTYTLGNTGRLPKFYLLVRDKLPPGLAFEGGPPPLVLGLWPGEEAQARCVVVPQRRGVFAVGPAQVYSTDPLGLQTFTQKMPRISELVVYPAVLPLRDSWLRGVAAQGWRGTADALARGDGDDFYGVREYQPGDALHRVHWRTTARTGVLAVTEYAQGVTLDVVVALDLSREAYADTGVGGDSALEYAVTLAATLLDDLSRHGHTVRLLLPGADDGADADQSGGAERMPRFLETLARAQADAGQPLADVLAGALGEGRAATLVTITPAAADPRLQDWLAGWEARGGQRLGFALDAASFRPVRVRPPGLPGTWGGPSTRAVRRGDDLQALMERQAQGNEGGGSDGWNG